LLREVLRIRDRYDDLKMYIEAAREMGLEAGARRMELESRTISDLARAVQEMPPGPPPKDLIQWLQRLDLDLLLKLTKDPNKLAKYAKRFGVDEQTLAERAALMLRERAWENVTRLSPDELKKILMDEQLLKEHASKLGVSEDKLRTLIEEQLQKHMGVRPPPEPQPMPEKPPIERIAPKRDQFKPPETDVSEGVVTREGQVLIVKPKEEGHVTVRRLEELPDVQARLRALLRRRLQEKSPATTRGAAKDVESARASDEQVPKTRPKETGEQTPRVKDEQTPRAEEGSRVKEEQTVRVGDEQIPAVETAERVVVDRDTLRAIVPALPTYVFAMPAPTVLAFISRAVGAPMVLAPNLPRPLPRESFGAWLDRVFAGTGFSWRSLAAQRETFVFA